MSLFLLFTSFRSKIRNPLHDVFKDFRLKTDNDEKKFTSDHRQQGGGETPYRCSGSFSTSHDSSQQNRTKTCVEVTRSLSAEPQQQREGKVQFQDNAQQSNAKISDSTTKTTDSSSSSHTRMKTEHEASKKPNEESMQEDSNTMGKLYKFFHCWNESSLVWIATKTCGKFCILIHS